ncbi:MAG: sialidase family protein [Bacteroidales bacterium]
MTGDPLILQGIGVTFTPDSKVTSLDALTAWYTGVVPGVPTRIQVGTADSPSLYTLIKGNLPIGEGKHTFVLDFSADPASDPAARLKIESVSFQFSDGSSSVYVAGEADPVIRFGKIVRAAGQDGVDTYRIPGLVTTNAGTLVAVYDIRYNNSKDLQEDIDIGMSRSTDGGRTWEPMRVIMDMGEYGGLPQNLNGAGDPSILYDHTTNTLWVAALWMSGSAPDKMLWWASQPGMTPQETGQFILVKSTDDGLTWSEPINITSQIKDPAWQLLLQGPGRGITLADGTLVFPAQFKADVGVKALDGGQYTCHSTLVYSRDGGVSWQIGTGAKSNTTEAQVVQLSDGTLMLNMRDDCNRADKGETNGRAVAVTADLGKSWTIHPSSNSALP